jgi:aspartate carbamoyltransferase regulatory subunit
MIHSVVEVTEFDALGHIEVVLGRVYVSERHDILESTSAYCASNAEAKMKHNVRASSEVDSLKLMLRCERCEQAIRDSVAKG